MVVIRGASGCGGSGEPLRVRRANADRPQGVPHWEGAGMSISSPIGSAGTALDRPTDAERRLALRRQSEGLALGYVTVRVVESTIIAVGIVSLLAVMTLRQDLAGVAGTDNASLILNGRSLVAVHDATFLLGPGVLRWHRQRADARLHDAAVRTRAAALRPVRHGRRLPRPAYGPSRAVRGLRPSLWALGNPDAPGGHLGVLAAGARQRRGAVRKAGGITVAQPRSQSSPRAWTNSPARARH